MTRSVRVHQYTATLSPRDAVGHHTLAVDDLLRELGHDTTLFATSIHPELRGRARHYRDTEGAPPDVLLYQASTGSPVADLLIERSEPLIVDYHNLTPAELFDPWEPTVGAELDAGRRQLARLVRRAARGIADSRYNADELVALGLTDTVVAPVLFDPPDPAPRTPRAEGRPPTLLFVGRLAPNKRQEAIIGALAALRRDHPDARLVLVGTASSARYEEALRALADRVCPGGVDFAGSVSAEALAAHYATADVFVCLSDHEGFCVPVIEAMAAGLPVVAHRAAVIPETVGDAAVLIDDQRPTTVATAVDRVLRDRTLSEWLVAAGRDRAGHFAPDRTRVVMRDALRDAIAALT